jgi:hypothetical protein
MVDDDGSFLSRRLRWEPETVPDADADAGHAPSYEPDGWDDTPAGDEAGRTQIVAPSGHGVSAGPSFERRELDRLDMEALDRRRQLWRDTSLILSFLLVVLIGANVLIPELAGSAGASPTPIPTGVAAGGASAEPSGGAPEPALEPFPSAAPAPSTAPHLTQPPTGTAPPTQPGATATARPNPTPTRVPATPKPTRTPAPPPTPEITPAPTPAPPTAAFGWSQALPLIVSFSNASTGETDWSWDFGDGNTSSQQNPDHTYLEAKDYVVRLTVTGPGGSDFVEHTVTVSAT